MGDWQSDPIAPQQPQGDWQSDPIAPDVAPTPVGSPDSPATMTSPSAMTPEEMSRTGQTQFEPSTVTAGTEPTKISEALRANLQPMLEHPVDSFTGMFTNWDDVRHLLQQPQDIAGPTLKHALGMPVAPQEEIGSQNFYNTGIGAALAAGAMRGGEKPPSVTDQIRESMTPGKPTEAPVNAPEAPAARPDTEAVSPQPPEAADTGSKPVDVPQETPTLRPQNEPRPTDQAVGESAGQQPPLPEQSAGMGGRGESGVGVEAGQRTEGAPAGTSNRQNVETYGKDEVPSGAGVDTGELLDNARAAIRNRSVNPYSVLSKTRDRGIANPEEYAALAAEHERLVNDAVVKEKAGDPTAPEAAQQAKDFANAIQPHKTAASDLFRLFQGDLNYDLGTQFGMDQYMQSELGHGLKPKDVPRFRQMSNDIRGAEGEVPQAVTRSDARVQGRYRNVADIPIQDAATRVREMLKDCV